MTKNVSHRNWTAGQTLPRWHILPVSCKAGISTPNRLELAQVSILNNFGVCQILQVQSSRPGFSTRDHFGLSKNLVDIARGLDFHSRTVLEFANKTQVRWQRPGFISLLEIPCQRVGFSSSTNLKLSQTRVFHPEHDWIYQGEFSMTKPRMFHLEQLTILNKMQVQCQRVDFRPRAFLEIQKNAEGLDFPPQTISKFREQKTNWDFGKLFFQFSKFLKTTC